MAENTAENNISEILNEYLHELDFRVQHPDALMGLSTGFDNLDKRLDGLRNGEVILIGGRPGMGRTLFVINIAYNMSSIFYSQKQQNPKDDKCVVFITLEASPKWFVKQLLSMVSEVPSYQMWDDEYIWDNFNKIANTARRLEKLPLYFCATECSVEGITTEIRKIRRQREIGCVIIDYLQLLSREYPEKEDLTGVLAEIKNMAVAFKVPIVLTTLLSRNLEKRADKLPILCDIRGLCNNLNAVDKVLFLYREHYYINNNEPIKRPKETDEKFQKRHNEWKERCDDTENFCNVIIAKNSSGHCGYVKMFFEGWIGRFRDWKYGY